ncbi:DUF6527 family protein [Maricaulis maris]|uniref:DUF6527 family protein n=1 Tax=Maricaulis maris TaxID=74318 RepID=UPI003B8E6572
MKTNRDNAPARYVPPDEWDYTDRHPVGSFTIEEEGGERDLIARLPDGSYGTCPLLPRSGSGPSWFFNGDLERPTLRPSVRQLGTTGQGKTFERWHGWLKDGEWVSC